MATLGHGKICYLHVPALDAETSSAFYRKVFGWNVRRREDGALSFDDGVGEVSGAWLVGHPPIDAGFLYIMTDDIERTLRSVEEEGGEVLEAPDPDAPEIVAQIQDLAGNVFGVYQERGLKGREAGGAG